MYNLIKMDLYRLLKTKSTYIMVFVVMAMTIFTVWMTKMDIDMMKEDSQLSSEDEIGPTTEAIDVDGDSVAINIGIFSETKDEWTSEKIKFGDFVEVQLASGIFTVIIAIFVSIFVHADVKKGFIKNIAGQVQNKYMLIISKIVGVGAQNLIMFLTLFVTMFVAGKICFGEQFVMGSALDLIKVVGGQYMLHMAFSVLLLALCILFNSSELSMTLGILLACRVGTLLYFGINKLAQNVLDIKDFNMGKYAIETNIYSFSGAMENEAMIKSMILGVIYIVISAVIASFIIQKRDVN